MGDTMAKAKQQETQQADAPKSQEAQHRDVQQQLMKNLPAGAVLVDDGDVDTVIALEFGNEFVGQFVGTKRVVSDKMKQKENNMHRFRSQDGQVVGVWGAHQLDQMLGKVEPGTIVWICQTGERQLENNNTMKLFTVARLKGWPAKQ